MGEAVVNTSLIDDERDCFPWRSAPTRQWYVVQTKPRQELRAIDHLRRRAIDVETFLPKVEVVRRLAGRRIAFTEPLFPGYVFMHASLDAATWNAVRWVPGIRRILGDGVVPIAVPDACLEEIRRRVEPLGFLRIDPSFKTGDRVRLRTGSFAGLEGVFERPLSRAGRVHVLLSFLGTLTRVETDVLDLQQV